jgi:hypothetical protein
MGYATKVSSFDDSLELALALIDYCWHGSTLE